MYAGHAAIALVAKAKRPTIPVALLVPLSFGPDWVSWVLLALHRRNEMLSHSLVAVGLGAAVCGGVYYLATRSGRDALTVGLVYASHWPLDFITGIKPTWPGGPDVGLHLYQFPVADIVVESVVVLVCWWIYRRSFPPARRRNPLGLLVPIGLIGLQFGFALIQQPSIKDPLREAVTELGVE